VRVVHRVDVRAKLAAQERRERVRVAEARDLFEGALERLDPTGLDGPLVEERGVVVADLSELRSRRGVRGLVEDVLLPFLDHLLEP
jgi:hypothetical protein